MPVNSFSVGKDISFVLSAQGSNLTLSGLTDYTVKPLFTKLTRKGLDGIANHAAIPDGWEITIKYDRKDATMDNFFEALERAYFAGTNISNGTLSENIQESDGSVSKFQYTDVSLCYEDAGAWKGDSYIPITISLMAARRFKLS